MKKLFALTVAGVLLLVITLSGTLSKVFAKDEASLSAQTETVESVDSYVMFWPLVSGRTEGDKLYSLKIFKEKVQNLFTFGDTKKVDYLILLGTKRLLEAEKLLNSGQTSPAQRTLDKAESNFSQAYEKARSAKEKGKFKNNEVRKDRVINAKTLLEHLKTKAPGSLHTKLDSVKAKTSRLLSDFLP